MNDTMEDFATFNAITVDGGEVTPHSDATVQCEVASKKPC